MSASHEPCPHFGMPMRRVTHDGNVRRWRQVMTVRGLVTRITCSIIAMLAVASLSAPSAKAAEKHDHGGSAPSALVKLVRQITEPYKSVAAAEAAGYGLAFG